MRTEQRIEEALEVRADDGCAELMVIVEVLTVSGDPMVVDMDRRSILGKLDSASNLILLGVILIDNAECRLLI